LQSLGWYHIILEMKIKKIFIIGGVALVLILGFIFSRRKGEEASVAGVSSEGSIILYTTEICPHCRVVENWLAENEEIKKKSGLTEKDANSAGIADEMIAKMKECNLDASQGIRVPLLSDNGECFLGDQPIIDYLFQKYQ